MPDKLVPSTTLRSSTKTAVLGSEETPNDPEILLNLLPAPS